MPSAPPLLAATGDPVVETLLARARAMGPPLVGVVEVDRGLGLGLLEAGEVVAVGGHGGPAPECRVALRRVHLADREVGLVAPRGRMVPSIARLPRMRLAARPGTAGVRRPLDEALRAQRLDPERVLSQAELYPSHRDVCCAVARGDADVGLTTVAWAARLGLAFRSLATEAYGLIVREMDMDHPAVVRLVEAAQSDALRVALARVPGCDASRSGEITSVG